MEDGVQKQAKAPGEAFERLCQIMKRLRSPGGCPWDAKQTPESLKPYILEETYELIEAIDLKNKTKICEELGDLLLQVVFQATIFSEQGDFTPADVANGIADKLVRRHPHVFANRTFRSEDDLHRQWDAIKKEESREEPTSVYDRIPRPLPALARAQKLIKRAAREGDRLPNPTVPTGAPDNLAALPSDERELAIGSRLAAIIQQAEAVGCDAETALLSWVDDNLNHLKKKHAPPGSRNQAK